MKSSYDMQLPLTANIQNCYIYINGLGMYNISVSYSLKVNLLYFYIKIFFVE